MTAATTVISQMQSAFLDIFFGLIVAIGIGGGVPSKKNDILREWCNMINRIIESATTDPLNSDI
jgi:hypothetical protein